MLHLTLKKKWFDMIASGEKKEEYREIKPYWMKRFVGKSYKVVQFRNGYSENSPTMVMELKCITVGIGKKEWGAPDKKVYILHLGDFIRRYGNG